MNDLSKYETIIGLEVHAQLKTTSKLFCACSTKFGSEPNSQVCPVCLGLPGSLPVLNKKAVEFAIKLGIVTHCQIANFSIFARKNYFYPDLPKGYQISQYNQPLCRGGYLEIELNGLTKKINIRRIHLEEDAGKSIHAEKWLSESETLIDLNRCGVPLVEIVTEPEIRSAKEAHLFLSRLKQILQYLDICDGNMEEGSLRCDANISIRPVGMERMGVKTELKNMNSFQGVEKALEYERRRQIHVLLNNGKIRPDTLLWDEKNNRTIPMRKKEREHDYRYFPEPDLLPLEINNSWVQMIAGQLPEMPDRRRDRFVKKYKLPRYDAEVLTENKNLADYFERVAKLVSDSKLVSNWIMSEVLRVTREQEYREKIPVTPESLAELLNLILEKVINLRIAKDVFREMVETGKSATYIVEQKKISQLSDEDKLIPIIDTIIEQYPDMVNKYQAGKSQLLDFFVGQVMRETRGRADPQVVNRIIRDKLSF